MWFEYDSLYYIFLTVDSLATKLGLMIHHCMPEYPVEKVGLLHSGSRSQQRVKMLMFVQMISSIPPNILFPNLVLWCIIMSQSVMQRDWFVIFKVKFTARAHMIKIWQFLLYLLNCWQRFDKTFPACAFFKWRSACPHCFHFTPASVHNVSQHSLSVAECVCVCVCVWRGGGDKHILLKCLWSSFPTQVWSVLVVSADITSSASATWQFWITLESG